MLKLTLVLISMAMLNGWAESNSPLSRVTRAESALSLEAQKFFASGVKVNTSDVGHLIDLVEKHNAGQCLARIICELIADNKAHGDAGITLGRALLKFRDTKHSKSEYYQKAMKFGAKSQQKQCEVEYKGCTHSSEEIVEVGNRVLNQ